MADTLIKVRVQPGSSRNELAGKRDGALIIRVTAQPADGKANSAACKLLPNRNKTLRTCRRFSPNG